jgi:hypothetical protein
MRYLTLIPDYTQSCIKDDFNGIIEVEELELPQDFIAKILSWHLAYRKIIPLDAYQREILINEIEELDREGLKLAKELSKLLSGGAKVKYFSEGKLKHLW